MPFIADQETIDSIVESAYSGKRIDVDVRDVADEDEIEGLGDVRIFDPFNAMNPEYLTDLLDDFEILAKLGMKNISDLNDTLRLKCALQVIVDLWGGDEGNHALVCAIELCDSRKRKALIAFELAGGYMLEFPPVTTIGVFQNQNDIREVYKDRGYITREDSPEFIKEQLRRFFSWN